MDQTTDTLLSPREAARATGCSRSSIMRALSSRTLPATRGNDNGWLIRREDLDRWSAHRATPGPDPVQDQGPLIVRTVSEPDQFSARLEALATQVEKIRIERDQAQIEAAVLRVELAQTHQRLAETADHLNQRLAEARAEREREVAQLREDRDRWHLLATKPTPTPVSQAWLARIWASLRPAGM